MKCRIDYRIGYTDQQRLNFLHGWSGWTAELRAAVDAAIDAHRQAHAVDETQCCLDCGTPCVPCTHGTCSGGSCGVCP